MILQRPLIVAASMALAALPAPVLAQAAGAAPKPGQPNKEQIEDAAFEMRVFVSAMSSDKVEAPVKDALMGCLYQNNFQKISEAIGKVVAQNPDKIAKRNPEQILTVLAGVCGYRPAAPAPAAGAAPAAPAKPAPAKPAPQSAKPSPQGR
jgi:hypothetical protein